MAKRALIVDDSKSARLFLARILEKYEIDVDNAENAESAIEYLTTHRPDVIFMDHLMPGMDGFQAVQAIKNNPLTATIPIMMYTSQEGELYLGQARALGAVGVLPKQIKPTDVSKVLYQLHLLQDRRSPQQTSFHPVTIAAEAEQTAANDSAVMPQILTETILREQFAELRRALVAGVDTQTERITAEVRALLLEALPPVPPVADKPPVAARPAAQWGWIVASAALVIALATTLLWRQQAAELRTLGTEVAQLRQDLVAKLDAGSPAAGRPELADSAAVAGSAGAAVKGGHESAPAPVAGARAAAAGTASGASSRTVPGESKPLVLSVPYGADALGGSRLDQIRQLLDRLVKENRSGVVDIKSFPGRFCLMGNANDGYSLAPDETSFSKCDLVGNPSDDALSPAQRTPLPFVNLAGAAHNASHGALNVQTSTGDAGATVAQYPSISPGLTAGEWNRVGGSNNRIEIRVH